MLNEKIREIVEDPAKVSGLTQKEVKELLEGAQRVLEKEPKLIELPPTRQTVFVGDSHGDFDATKIVIQRHLGGNKRLVFLGDYVDRGRNSEANINYLLCLKVAYPGKLFLLQGNHEGYGVCQFYPATFWEAIDEELRELYERVFLKLPLVVSTNDIIGLHGALPDVKTLLDINGIQIGDVGWKQVTWGDWQDIDGDYLGTDTYTGRPQFGRRYFDRLMERLEKNVLIRSHQPDTPQVMYNKHCLTIFTSHAYMPTRTIAIANLEKEIRTVDDLLIELI
ncbi:metallophosphoesterase family protein [Chloroflexota bacterium]